MILKENYLSENQQILLLYAVCLRISKFFKDFSIEFNFQVNQSGLLNECLEALGQNIFKGESLTEFCKKWIPILESITPDMDDYNSELLPSLALDAVTSTLTTLDYIASNNSSLINEVLIISMNAAEFIDDSIEEFSENYQTPKFKAAFLELRFVEEIKTLLTKGSEVNQENLTKLIAQYEYQSLS